MNENPNPVTMNTAPFVPTTTPAIERANRLLSLRTHPGFLELLRISQDLVNSTTETLVEYGGWDAQQITVLKVRAQAAKEHHQLLLSQIESAIQAGIEEAKALKQTVSDKTPAEIRDQGDYVRQKMLERFDDADMRIAGSYESPIS